MPSIAAVDLIASSMRLIGATASSEVPTATEITDGLAVLNDMLEQWSTESLTVFASQDQVITLVPGTNTYTIGPTGTTVGVRPIAIETAVVNYGGVDFLIEVTTDSERYNAISIKQQQGAVPVLLLYDPAFPNGGITLWPVPSFAPATLTLTSSLQFTQLANAAQVLAYPPGYSKALRYCLATELAPEYGIIPRPAVLQGAVESKAAIKRANVKDAMLDCDAALLGSGGDSYARFLSGY